MDRFYTSMLWFNNGLLPTSLLGYWPRQRATRGGRREAFQWSWRCILKTLERCSSTSTFIFGIVQFLGNQFLEMGTILSQKSTWIEDMSQDFIWFHDQTILRSLGWGNKFNTNHPLRIRVQAVTLPDMSANGAPGADAAGDDGRNSGFSAHSSPDHSDASVPWFFFVEKTVDWDL